MRDAVMAKDLMSRPVRQLTTRTPLRDAAAFLRRHGISGAPVVDEHGNWRGVFTQSDLARYVQERLGPRKAGDVLPEGFADTPVQKLMTPGLFMVYPESSLQDVVRTMTAYKVHRVFVLNEQDNTLLGIITTMDVLRRMNEQEKVGRRKSKQA